MIEFVPATPADEETAAIMAALTVLRYPEHSQRGSRRRGTPEVWAVAARHSDLQFDDLRVMAKSGRVF